MYIFRKFLRFIVFRAKISGESVLDREIVGHQGAARKEDRPAGAIGPMC